ncbi:MAG: signal transduction histidine kinase/DNA-binding response OmpR family regulator [Polaribacter sp.]|jgi:signal transduction histidine kinase/DNA-binding response OmpR family regulator
MNHLIFLKNILLLLLALLYCHQSAAQTFVNKDAKGKNDGSSWEDAYTNLHDALVATKNGDQIWVTSGTYLPGKPGDPKTTTFHLTKGLQLYGGFAGTETNLSERTSLNKLTILSGDLSQDDIPDDFETNRSDNVSTIMLVENKTPTRPIIDGFTFTGGHAAENIVDNEQSQGGGLLSYSSAIIRNCIFLQNHAGISGGALYFEDSIVFDKTSTLIIDSCQFQNNNSKYAGGIYGLLYGETSSISIKNSTFQKNYAGRKGGAIQLVAMPKSANNKFVIEHCDFENNYTTKTPEGIEGGGGVYISPEGTSTLTSISHSNFKKNRTAGWGGAMAIKIFPGSLDNRVNIDSCRFETNYADTGGALMYQSIGSNDSIFISHSQFIGNTIEDIYGRFATHGGAVHMNYALEGKKAYSRIENCLFENNTNKEGDGGALSITPDRSGSFSSIYNSVFRGNRASGKGAAFAYAAIDKAYELEGCTFDNNKATKGDDHIYEKPLFDSTLFYIFFHGVLWVQILYSLLLLLISRERTTFYYTLLMIGISLFFLAIIDFKNIPFFNSISTPDRFLFVRLALTFILIGLVKFAQHYLNVNYYYPRFKKLVLYFMIVLLLNDAVSIIKDIFPSWEIYLELGGLKNIIGNLIFLVSLLLPVVWAILVSRKGYQPAKYFLLAMLFTGIALVILIVVNAKFSHFLDAPVIAIQSLILGTIIALGLADGYRVNLLKKDKARAERLAELDVAKTRLYTNITHEFRTPLTVIMGASDLVKGNESEKDLIKRNSKQLLQLINQMLDLSKLEGNALKLQPQQGNIIPFTEYLVESFQSMADSKHVRLTFYRELDELNMDYDAEKMQQIISNLLSNAIKFTGASGKVIVHAKEELFDGKPYLTLAVRDNGTGIPEANIPHIFDRFFQVDDSDVRRSEGSGIGLALVKELVELMNGQIEVTSKVGDGTVFTVRIPISKVAPIQSEDINANELLLPTGSNKSKESALPFQPFADDLPLALIIEDNKDIVSFLRTCLQRKYKIEVAYNGREGIDKALEIIPDIIISDVMMPEADGFTVCKTLKADERTSHVPIILLTAKATQEDKVHGLDMGADAYLSKPFHQEELEVRLQKLIELRQQLQQRYQKNSNSDPTSINTEDTFIQKLRSLIEENMEDETFSIIDLCRSVGLSRMQVHRKLKALTGMPATTFIHTVRLQKAYNLLSDTDLNVSEVAYKVGFSNHSYFSKLFVNQYGKIPSEIGNNK